MILDNKTTYKILNKIFGKTKAFQLFLMGYLQHRGIENENTRTESF